MGSKRSSKKLREGRVVVCRKCGSKKDAEKLGAWIDAALDKKARKRAQVRTSGCFGVCPGKKRVAVLLGAGKSARSTCYVVDPARDRGVLIDSVRAALAV